MELRAEQIAPRHRCRDRLRAIAGSGGHIGRVSHAERIGMREIDMRLWPETRQDGVRRAGKAQPVPAHMRHAKALARLDARDLAADPSEPRRRAILAARLRHQLHADTNTEEGFAARETGGFQRLDHAGLRAQSGGAIGEMPDARQHDPLGGKNVVRPVGDADLMARSGQTRGFTQGAAGRVQVSGSVVDEGNKAHGRALSPAGPVREGESLPCAQGQGAASSPAHTAKRSLPMRSILPALSACLLMACAATPAWPDAAESEALSQARSQSELTESLASQMWDWAEVGYQEEKSSALLQDTLAGEGFTVTPGVAGIPTAFMAEYGSGGPVIALLAEFDALPGINQTASPVREEVPGKGAGHACGHNLFGAGSVSAAIAVRHWLEESGTPGRVRIYGTPAEEGGSGKVYMVRAGLFEDVDIAMHWHAGDRNTAAANTSLANRSAKFRFRGISAHAAGAPERGRSALDGVEAMNMMANMMHEHMPQDARMHYVITSGGSAPNVVPDFAEVFYYVRHPDPKGVEAIWARLEDAARGAAQGTGTKVDWEIIHGNNPLLVNEKLARMMDAKLRQVGGVEYTDAELEFAETIASTFDNPARDIASAAEIQPFEVSLGYGSTDVGDVSYAVPTVGLRTATWVPGTSAHSWQAVAASGTSIGYKGAQIAAETLTLAAVELFTNEDLRAEARKEFDEKRGPDYEYKSLLGDRDPPLDYRK